VVGTGSADQALLDVAPISRELCGDRLLLAADEYPIQQSTISSASVAAFL
jgi:hypothetical protein